MRLRFLVFYCIFLAVSSFSYVPVKERGIPLYYWEDRMGSCYKNFGDVLSEKIVERLVGHPINTTFNPSFSKHYQTCKLLALGSILHKAENGDIIWGSGINGKHLDPQDKRFYRFHALDVRACRGPLTRKFLLNLGVDCPEVYGDPGLLLPLLFPEFTKNSRPQKDYIILPHWSDQEMFQDDPHFVSITEDWQEILRQILDSQLVISSSLHGIIAAEAFGVPARYIKVSNHEPLFKYIDYYFGTGRPEFVYATTVEEALILGGEPPPECDLDALIKSFPYDAFPNAAPLR